MKVLLFSLALMTPLLSVQAEGDFFQSVRQLAARGEAESQFILGLAYRDGWAGTLQPGSTAAKWREMALEQGDLRPVLVLGLLKQEGVRVAADGARGIQCLSLAAERGDNYARVILGDMLLEGDGVPANWRGGAELIRKAAAEGFGPGQFRLGLIYLVGGDTTPRNEVEALAWFILAAEAGCKVAREFRDERTQALGREVASLAVKRSRIILRKSDPVTGSRW